MKRGLSSLLAAALLLATTAATPGPGAIGLVPAGTVFARLRSVRTATVAVYALGPTSNMTSAIVAAADRGAQISVALGRGAFGGAEADNAATAALLAQHRVRVHLSPTTSHIKAAILDGAVYLSDRNFASSSSETIVVLDTVPGDRELVERAILGQTGGNDHLWTRKADALEAEARVLRARASRSVVVSTESFGAGTSVFAALLERRRAGDRVRLLVGQQEYRDQPTTRHAVAALLAAGVEVRTSAANEKYLVDGNDVWFGSANATRGRPDQVDFGIATQDRNLAIALSSQFDGEWGQP
jgi:phosphatidylserine/phosphatidylglycerophosphate/cardiolipin synthase-like enzyme